MKCLKSLTDAELKKFFDSFDYALSDVDGVLWSVLETIPGTQEAIKSLKQIGKKVVLVSNNTAKSIETYHQQLIKAGFDVQEADIVTPTLSMISFLKKQNLGDKEIFLIGGVPLKERLQNEGFKIAPNGPPVVKSSSDYITHAVVDDGSVAAVIADADINLNYLNLQKAATFLERPEVLFLKGPTDTHMPIGKNKVLIGPGYFINILEDMSGREGLPMAKPGPYLNDYIVEKYKIEDPSRVLFIGDSIPSDMGFANTCNYKKLLVLSGLTKKEELENWKFPIEYKPDYYADNLKILHECIMRIYASKL